VEADVGGDACLLEEALEGAHRGVTPADLALRVGEDQARVLPAGGLHALRELACAVAPEDLYHAGPDPDAPLLPGLRGGDACLLPGIGGVMDSDRGPGTVELEILPSQGGVEGERPPDYERERERRLRRREHARAPATTNWLPAEHLALGPFGANL
jgi:hypothetical protein